MGQLDNETAMTPAKAWELASCHWSLDRRPLSIEPWQMAACEAARLLGFKDFQIDNINMTIRQAQTIDQADSWARQSIGLR